MNTRQFFSIMAMCVAFMASAQDAINNRTQEQFQQELTQFGEETRAMMMQEYISADSTDMLSEKQKKTLKYTKEFIFEDNSKLELPLEVNYLLGDTINKKHYKLTPIWEESYFVKSDSVVLIVPLQYDTLNLLQCQLRVENPNPQKNRHYHQIESLIGEYNEEKDEFDGFIVYSNADGNFHEIYRFEAGNCVEIIKNKMTHLGGHIYLKGRNKSSVRRSSRVNNISRPAIYRSDWRSANNKGYSRGSDGILRLNTGRSMLD